MNNEWLQECGICDGEMKLLSPLLPLNSTSFLHVVSGDIANAAQDMILATPLFLSTQCFKNCSTPFLLLFCTLAVNLPDNLAHYLDSAPVISLDICCTESFLPPCPFLLYSLLI